MKKEKKIGFFKRFKIAIFELENYIQFLSEKLGTAIGFCFKSILLLSLVMAVSNIAFIYAKYGSPGKYVDHIIPSFVYSDRKLTIDEADLDNDEKKAVASVAKQFDLSYVEIFQNETFEKTDLVNYVNNNETRVTFIAGLAIFLESILDLLFFWIIIGFLTSVVGWIVFRISRIKMKYSKLYSLSLYASTLTVVLTVIYTMLNSFFGIYIEFFDYLVMLIAYIYITAVIYMIRSDLIKQQLELIKIVTVQEQMKEQMEKEKEEEEQKENDGKDEKEPETDPDAEVEVKEKKKDNEPDGSEI